jgi:hypothetical protein
MPYIRFKHQDGKFDIVRINGLQACLDHGTVREFYRPSEEQWIDPLKDPIKMRCDRSIPIKFDKRRSILNLNALTKH